MPPRGGEEGEEEGEERGCSEPSAAREASLSAGGEGRQRWRSLGRQRGQTAPRQKGARRGSLGIEGATSYCRIIFKCHGKVSAEGPGVAEAGRGDSEAKGPEEGQDAALTRQVSRKGPRGRGGRGGAAWGPKRPTRPETVRDVGPRGRGRGTAVPRGSEAFLPRRAQTLPDEGLARTPGGGRGEDSSLPPRESVLPLVETPLEFPHEVESGDNPDRPSKVQTRNQKLSNVFVSLSLLDISIYSNLDTWRRRAHPPWVCLPNGVPLAPAVREWRPPKGRAVLQQGRLEGGAEGRHGPHLPHCREGAVHRSVSGPRR